jgi:hypothetical protein
VHPEAAFLSGYALVLIAVAAGLGRLGRRTTDPWSSRMLTASRQPGDASSDAGPKPGWPHSEVPAFHVVVGGVALVAALLLVLVSLVRHHLPVECVAQVGVLLVVGIRIARLASRYRAERRIAMLGDENCGDSAAAGSQQPEDHERGHDEQYTEQDLAILHVDLREMGTGSTI